MGFTYHDAWPQAERGLGWQSGLVVLDSELHFLLLSTFSDSSSLFCGASRWLDAHRDWISTAKSLFSVACHGDGRSSHHFVRSALVSGSGPNSSDDCPVGVSR